MHQDWQCPPRWARAPRSPPTPAHTGGVCSVTCSRLSTSSAACPCGRPPSGGCYSMAGGWAGEVAPAVSLPFPRAACLHICVWQKICAVSGEGVGRRRDAICIHRHTRLRLGDGGGGAGGAAEAKGRKRAGFLSAAGSEAGLRPGRGALVSPCVCAVGFCCLIACSVQKLACSSWGLKGRVKRHV